MVKNSAVLTVLFVIHDDIDIILIKRLVTAHDFNIFKLQQTFRDWDKVGLAKVTIGDIIQHDIRVIGHSVFNFFVRFG